MPGTALPTEGVRHEELFWNQTGAILGKAGMARHPRNLTALASTQLRNIETTRMVAPRFLRECEDLLDLLAGVLEVESGPRRGHQWGALRSLLSHCYFYLCDAVIAAASTSGYKVQLLSRAAIESLVYAVRVHDSPEAARAWLGRHKAARNRVLSVLADDPKADFRHALVENDELQEEARAMFERSAWASSLKRFLAPLPSGAALKSEFHLRYDIAVQMGAHPSWMGLRQFSTTSQSTTPGAVRHVNLMHHGDAAVAHAQLEELSQLTLYVLLVVASLLPTEADAVDLDGRLRDLLGADPVNQDGHDHPAADP